MISSAKGGAMSDPGAWIIRLAVAIIFVMIGVDKFDSHPNREWVRIFARIGLGQWFRVATGLIEVAGGALLILPITKRLGAAVLAITMVGACVAHITVLHDPVTCIVPTVLGGIAVVVGLDEPGYDMRQLWLKRSNPVSPPRLPTEGTKQ